MKYLILSTLLLCLSCSKNPTSPVSSQDTALKAAVPADVPLAIHLTDGYVWEYVHCYIDSQEIFKGFVCSYGPMGLALALIQTLPKGNHVVMFRARNFSKDTTINLEDSIYLKAQFMPDTTIRLSASHRRPVY